MRALVTLLEKDFRNARYALPPAVFLGLPLLLLMQFTQEDKVYFLSAFWICFFISSTSLFYRSFAQEHHARNFPLYRALHTKPLAIFASQALVHLVSLLGVGCVYFLLVIFLWSPPLVEWESIGLSILLASMALAPLGTLLGLMLQMEREFLFALIYFPLATPVILGAFGVSLSAEPVWLRVLVSFVLGGAFVSALIFEFFFDDLSQTY